MGKPQRKSLPIPPAVREAFERIAEKRKLARIRQAVKRKRDWTARELARANAERSDSTTPAKRPGPSPGVGEAEPIEEPHFLLVATPDWDWIDGVPVYRGIRTTLALRAGIGEKKTGSGREGGSPEPKRRKKHA